MAASPSPSPMQQGKPNSRVLRKHRVRSSISLPPFPWVYVHFSPCLDSCFLDDGNLSADLVCVQIFLSAADQTIIIASYGKIGSDLNALNLTSWITTSYFLTLTSFQPLYGRLSDIFGRKACLLFAYVVFGTGCLFCGLAQDIKQLIAARVCRKNTWDQLTANAESVLSRFSKALAAGE